MKPQRSHRWACRRPRIRNALWLASHSWLSVPLSGGRRINSSARIPFLDGLRGVLACVVVASHVMVLLGSEALYLAAYGAVWVFFVMSGLVLSRSYDGRYLPFLIRRLVRLWPVYGLCVLAGYGVLREPPVWRVLVWYPWPDLSTASDWFRPDLPAWSLCVEAWAMPFMPLIAWFGRGSIARAILISTLR